MRLVETKWLPREPTLQQDVIRMVRWGMADILEALGEEPGPKPGEPIHAMWAEHTLSGEPIMFVSKELHQRIMAEITPAETFAHLIGQWRI